MTILAIETSSEHASVALLHHDKCIECCLEGQADHSRRLLPAIERLLSDAGLALRSLDGIAFGAGPGAFTGLRLACATAQGLAMGLGLGVRGVCSLDSIGYQCDHEAVVVATDARMGEIYTAAYRRAGGRLERIGEILCIPPEQFALPDGSHPWFGAGAAFALHGDVLARRGGSRLQPGPPLVRARARDLAVLAAQQKQWLAPEQASPLYVRNKVALTTAERLARGGRA